MSEPTAPEPLPGADDGPTSPARVAAWLQGAVDPTDPALIDSVAAVNASLRRWLRPAVAATTDAPPVWAPDHTHGATMLAGRFYRRRSSPSGIDFTSATEPTYLRRSDPDIAMMLGIGDHAAPAVG